uniref:CDGSH iron-sulfur domain-containing protein 2 n=1 Tax=Sus scrofa TaxID=9823 RepID=A0A4X1VB39_PIG
MSPLFQPLVHALVARLLVESGRDRGCGLRARRGASPAVEWIAAVTIAAGTAAIGYLAYKRFYVKDHRNKSMVNPHIQKDNPKVVHAFDMEDLGDKAVYCRCWRSKKFPLCDGSHIKHNEETGDNVGPLIIKKKDT